MTPLEVLTNRAVQVLNNLGANAVQVLYSLNVNKIEDHCNIKNLKNLEDADNVTAFEALEKNFSKLKRLKKLKKNKKKKKMACGHKEVVSVSVNQFSYYEESDEGGRKDASNPIKDEGYCSFVLCASCVYTQGILAFQFVSKYC